jgi:hypothetical protein
MPFGFPSESAFGFAGILRDEACFRDYLSATHLSGLALRKKIAELIFFGCGFIVEDQVVGVVTTKAVGTGAARLMLTMIVITPEPAHTSVLLLKRNKNG